MNSSLQEQLANLEIPRLATILRSNLELPDGSFALERAAEILVRWCNKKAEPYNVILGGDVADLSFAQNDFKIEYARSLDSLTLSLEESDSRVRGRSWICDVALTLIASRTRFSLRLGYRQPNNATNRPDPRGPRFLRQLVDDVGGHDVWDLTGTVRQVNSENLPFFMNLIQSPQRLLPVIAISEDGRTGDSYSKSDRLAQFLAGTAHVVRLEFQASKELSSAWGSEWSAFQGAIRCYNPKFDRSGDKFKHRLWLPESIDRMDAFTIDGFLNTCIGHVFTQVTAQFEPSQFPTPASIRRQILDLDRERAQRLTTETIVDSEISAPKILQVDLASQPDEASEPSSVFMSDDQLRDAEKRNEELATLLARQEDENRRLEQSLAQERVGRAEVEKAYEEVKLDLELHQETVRTLDERRRAFEDSSQEPSEPLRPLWTSFSGFFNTLQNVTTQFRRLEGEAGEAAELGAQLHIAEEKVKNLSATIESINRRTALEVEPTGGGAGEQSATIRALLPLIAQKNPSLCSSLNVIQAAFPERLIVLKSAYEAAEKSEEFKHGEQAFDLLWLLVTRYWESLASGAGDGEAKAVFGKSYAARDKDNISKRGKKLRTFHYDGTEMLMEKHIKLGNAFNSADTLRVHFEWIADEKRIVVGHCGGHLDF